MEEQPGEITVGRLLEQNGLQLAIAESCTGGLVGHWLTNVPGSSKYFLGGVIAYSNELKMELLGVRRETLERQGAVSQQVVLEMARGARSRLNADLGLSISGIAGPDGGTPDKPVGLVWFGLSSTQAEEAHSFIFSGNRSEVKQQAARVALELLTTFIQSQPGGMSVPAEEAQEVSMLETSQEGKNRMDSIEVTVRFDTQGKAIPLQFSWRGRDFRVESTGRRWEDETGQHFLVMIPGGRVLELLYAADDRRWYLRAIGENRMKV